MPSPDLALSTQVIGQAGSAIGAILDPLLDRAAITFHQWIVLVVLSARGGAAAREDLVRQLIAMRRLREAGARLAIDGLTDAGLAEMAQADQAQADQAQVLRGSDGLTDGGLASAGLADLTPPDQAQVRLTLAGQKCYGQIREQVEAITSRIFGNLPEADIETAARVLESSPRANAEIAAAQN